MGISNNIEQIELGLDQVYQDVQILKENNVDNTTQKKNSQPVPIRVGLNEDELQLVSEVKCAIVSSGDFRNCSHADILRLALRLLDTSRHDEILECFEKIKRLDRRTSRWKKTEKNR